MSEENGVKCYVLVHNIAKRHNVGTLARSATAFGVSELILVGRRDFNAFGSHGSTSHLGFRHFFSLLDARNFLKERDCDICGVEITDNALPVNQHPFKRSTAFLLGNEGTGLSTKELEICDFFVYIPQYGCGTASLNVTVAASIVLHHFAGKHELLRTDPESPSVVEEGFVINGNQYSRTAKFLYVPKASSIPSVVLQDCLGDQITQLNPSYFPVWAGFPERTREGNKFVVAERPARQTRRSFSAESEEAVKEERRIRRENASNEFSSENGDDAAPANLLNTLFDNAEENSSDFDSDKLCITRG